MLSTILIIIGILFMLARGFGFLVPTKPNMDLGWIGASFVAIAVLLLIHP
jgi:hypothetical protein